MTSLKMTEKEHVDACVALTHWFESQGIGTLDGAVIMAMSIGGIIGLKATDELSMMTGLRLVSNLAEDYGRKIYRNRRKGE